MTEPVADPSIAATFTCSRCGRPAARVAVVPAGQPLPAPVVAPSGFPPASTPAFDTFLRVVIDAVGLGGSMAGSSIDAVVPRVRAALEAGDAAALYAANLEIGRFWCPACAASYCGLVIKGPPVSASTYQKRRSRLRVACPAPEVLPGLADNGARAGWIQAR